MKKSFITSLWGYLRQKFKSISPDFPDIPPDKNNSVWLLRQIWVALAPLILTVSLGMISGYSAVLLPQLQLNVDKDSGIVIDEDKASWIASMAALPMAMGSIIGGVLNEKFGRRSTHMIVCLPMVTGWLFIYFATNTDLILIGRFLTGLCTGILGSSTGVYIGETSEPQYRGFLLGAISLAISLGLMLSHVIGTYLHWQTTALVCSSLPVISMFLLLFVPESPSWLAKKGKTSRAEKSFRWCRGYSDEAKKELAIMLERQEEDTKNMKLKDTFLELKRPEFFKPLGIIVIYIVANQWAGVNALTFYTVTIMKTTIGNGLDEYIAMFIVDFIRIVMSVLACILMRNFRRRPLAIISGVGTFLSLFVLSGYTWQVKKCPELKSASYIPMAALVAYISFISIGFVPLPWALVGELFPLKSRSIGSGISSFMAFTAFFSVVKTSPTMFQNLEPAGTFLVYGSVALFGTVFIYLCLPETKGKRLHEIEDYFKKQRTVTETENVGSKHNNRL